MKFYQTVILKNGVEKWEDEICKACDLFACLCYFYQSVNFIWPECPFF